MAAYSASGPTRNVFRVGPDAAAVSDDSAVLRGVYEQVRGAVPAWQRRKQLDGLLIALRWMIGMAGLL